MSESYIALYRKYRPNSFSDVVGQEHIVSLLTAAVQQKKISHAYLFCGGRGTGKTTVARIFAREIGCNPEDIIEIDAASNRGIDEIRELREAVRSAPFSSPYKVYIVDEAHMLTKEAANALLKTLEEPPAHVVFILATTDPEKLPETIVSRCQKLVFKSPDLATLTKRLRHVAEEEGKTLEEATAHLIASHGKGSYRDALGALEQVLTQAKKTIVHEEVMVLLGATGRSLLLEIITALGTHNSAAILEVCSALENSSAGSLRAYDELVELIRVGLLSRIGKKDIPEDIAGLAQAYPYVISSKTILSLLESRHLLEVSSLSSWTAFQAIMLNLLEGEIKKV